MKLKNIKLLKFIKPIWYLYLETKDKKQYWVNYTNLSDNHKHYIDYYNCYEDKKTAMLDVSYQAWQKGYIVNSRNVNSTEDINHNLSLFDQYVFIKRMFKPIWARLVFIYRLLTFCNPIKEIKAFFKTQKINQININHPNFEPKGYIEFQSKLVEQSPMISIIIPTLNRYLLLKDSLQDLQKQEYTNFEVIIVDQSTDFDKLFYNQFNLDINLIHQKVPGLWKARNLAIRNARGEYILFFDDDSRIGSDWIKEHLKSIDYFKADLSAGVSISKVGDSIPEHYNYFRLADQLDTGNVLIKLEVFKKCGLFDLQFEGMRMGDGEFGARAYINGFKSINNPKAWRLHLKGSTGGLRDMGSWDGMRPMKWFSVRPVPSILYYFRKYWGNRAALYKIIQTLPFSLISYSQKGKFFGHLFSLLFFLIFFPLVFIQLLRSWQISSSMLDEGSKIEKFWIK